MMQTHPHLNCFKHHDTLFTAICLANAVAGVHDGYVLTKSVSRSPIGGRLLNSCLQKDAQQPPAKGCSTAACIAADHHIP
jgi:hypothetical protein